MIDFDNTLGEMLNHQMKLPEQKVSFCLPDARKVLANAMSYFLNYQNRPLQWLAEYDEVADWLTDSKGRGLLMYGNCGRGKSLLTRYVLPAIFMKYHRKVFSVYDVQEMNSDLNAVLRKCLLALDDIGTEEAVNDYGIRRQAFAEIIDRAEKDGKLVIISTNLDQRDLLERYGDRTMDRLMATTKRIVFEGESLRR